MNSLTNNHSKIDLPIDMIFHIMTFVDHLQIFKRLAIVSKDWRQAAGLFKFNIDFSIYKIHPHKVSLFFNATSEDYKNYENSDDMIDEEMEQVENMEDEQTKSLKSNITSLSFAFNFIGNKGLKISNCSELSQLQHLNLRSNGINFEGMNALSNSKYIKNLKSLNLRLNKLGKESLEVLSESENFKHLTDLNLLNSAAATSDSRFTIFMEDRTDDEAYRRIVKSPHLRNLKILNLRFCDISNMFAKDLYNNPEMSNLTTLNLQHNYIGDEGAKYLSMSSHLSSLTNLNLQFNCLSTEGGSYIAKSSTFSNLKILNLSNNSNLKSEDIFTSPYLAKLEILNLGNALIDSSVLKALVTKTCFLYNLKSLDLGSNNIDDECLGYIANCPSFSNLTYLEIYPTAIVKVDLNILFQSPFLKLTNLVKKNRMYFQLPDISEKLIPSQNLSHLNSIVFACSFELIKDVLESPFLSNLTQLSLGERTEWTTDKYFLSLNGKIKSITGNPALSNLKQLSLLRCNLNDQDFIEILNCPHFVNLTSLNVDGNSIGDKGMKAFESSTLTRQLKFLHLTSNQFTDEGVKYLTNGKPTNLICLVLSSNMSLTDASLKMISQIDCNLTSLRLAAIKYITDEGIQYITTSPFMKELQSFDVEGSKITKIGAYSALLNLKLLLRSQKTFFRGVIEKQVPKKKV